MGVNMDNIQALLRGGSSSRPTDQNGAAENGQEDRADIQLPGMMSNHDREKIHALFKLQSEYLDRMDSLFSDENETLAELDNRLLAAQLLAAIQSLESSAAALQFSQAALSLYRGAEELDLRLQVPG